jgi:chromosome partitioning protein
MIPLQAEFLALKGLTKLGEVVEKVQKRLNKDLTLAGVFLTRYDTRLTLNKRVLETAEARFPGKVFKTVIRNNVAIAEAPAAGLDIFRYASSSNGAEDYSALAKELLKITLK